MFIWEKAVQLYQPSEKTLRLWMRGIVECEGGIADKRLNNDMECIEKVLKFEVCECQREANQSKSSPEV